MILTRILKGFKLDRLFKKEEGNALVIFALGLAVFLGFAALVTDVGLLYLNKIRLTNSLDAAALAGAQELPNSGTLAKNVTSDYLQKNGVNPNQVDIDVNASEKRIILSANKNVGLFFAKTFGRQQALVNAKTAARVGAITQVQGIVPLAIEEQNFDYSQTYVLKSGVSSYGWFGPLALGGTGSSIYENNLMYGYQGLIKIGDILMTQTGNVSGSTKKSVEYRIAQDKHYPLCTNTNYVKECSRIITIPVIKHPTNPTQVKEVEVVGFAAFFITDVTGNGNDSYITGYFIKYVMPGEIDVNKSGFGLNGVKLVN